MFTGCLGARRHRSCRPEVRNSRRRIKTSIFQIEVPSTHINALIRRAVCSMRIFGVFFTVLGAEKRGEKDAKTTFQKKRGENRKKTGTKSWGVLSGGLSKFTRGFIYPKMNLNTPRIDSSDFFASSFEPTLMARGGEAHRADAFINPPFFILPWCGPPLMAHGSVGASPPRAQKNTVSSLGKTASSFEKRGLSV